jgi:hypothetical protein
VAGVMMSFVTTALGLLLGERLIAAASAAGLLALLILYFST